jgi:hypothetical protein
MQVIRHLWARSNTAGDGGEFGNRVVLHKLGREQRATTVQRMSNVHIKKGEILKIIDHAISI